MSITTLSLTNTFFEQMIRINDIIAYVNGVEAGTSNVQNTAIIGTVFKAASNNSGLAFADTSIAVDDTLYLDVGTLGTDVTNTATHIIASMNVVNTVHQTTRSSYSAANDASTTAASAYTTANAASSAAANANTTAASAYGQANSALTTAQGAFTKANSSTVADDTSPQLSANLDAQMYSFENVGTISIESGERVDFKGSDELANATLVLTGSGLEIYTREAGNSATTLRAIIEPAGDIVPGFDGENSLGKSSKGWNNGYFADGAIIYMGGHEISQSGNVITVDADVSMNAWVGSSGRFDDIATPANIWAHANNKVITTDGAWDALGYKAESSAASITLDMNANANFNIAVGQTMTLANPTNPKPGQAGTIIFSANGAHTVSYGTDWVFEDDSAPSNSGNTAARDILSYVVTPNKKLFAVLFTNVPVT